MEHVRNAQLPGLALLAQLSARFCGHCNTLAPLTDPECGCSQAKRDRFVLPIHPLYKCTKPQVLQFFASNSEEVPAKTKLAELITRAESLLVANGFETMQHRAEWHCPVDQCAHTYTTYEGLKKHLYLHAKGSIMGDIPHKWLTEHGFTICIVPECRSMVAAKHVVHGICKRCNKRGEKKDELLAEEEFELKDMDDDDVPMIGTQ
jgi:hypothetical protein